MQTKQGVSSILKGTFMENTVEDSDGSALDYAQAFMDIGEETGVSPYHLASRVRQEQGLKGTSSLISGTYSGYEGYYNYFNVGAAGITSTLVIKNGLAYAKKRDGIPVMQHSKEERKFWRKTTLAWARIRCISRSLM